MNYSEIYIFISESILTTIGDLIIFKPINIKPNEGIEIAGNASVLYYVCSFGVLLFAIILLSLLESLKDSSSKSVAISSFPIISIWQITNRFT